MRINLSLTIAWLFFCTHATAQSAHEIIAAVKKAQRSVQTAAYQLKRTDTLVTGHYRIITGKAVIQTDTSNLVLGFNFWAKEADATQQMILNRNMVYITNDKEQTYQTSLKPEPIQFMNQSGGRIIMPDLVRLDTSNVIRFDISSDVKHYFLKMVYADLDEHDVRNRYKLVEINKSNMLPVAVRHHQETMGKVQDLYYTIDELQLNGSAGTYDFAYPPFLKTYIQKTKPISSRHPLFQLVDKPAPEFNLDSFDGRKISLPDAKGKVVLLDFWEVWCGPCLESMPKIQSLFEKYRSKGLLIYAITNDLKQLEIAKRYANRKKELTFTFLVGNESITTDYKIYSFPQYVLIDKSGKVSFVSEGLSSELDGEIRKAVGGR